MRGALTLLSLVAATPAFGWGCDAHRIVALIAWARASDGARTAAAALLAADPVPPQTLGCGPSTPNPLADVSMWADAVREDEPETAPWHYVDVPRDADRAELRRACRSGRCVTEALERQLALVRSGAPTAERARALRFVVHLVADLHQPLHATTNGDRGGNCVPVTYFGERTRPSHGGERWSPNLHAIWDTDLLRSLLRAGHEPASGYAVGLARRFADEMAHWQREPPRIEDWAWETHAVGADVAYGRLPRSIPIEPHVRPETCRANREIGRRMAELHLRVEDGYVDAVRTALDTQLAKAGARLAGLLDRSWP
jgi:hypothetical protein